MVAVPSRQVNRNRGIRDTSSYTNALDWIEDHSRSDTDLTSRGVPARFKILTTTWTPFKSSKTRRAGLESTRTQSKVSSMTEAKGTSQDFGGGAEDGSVLGDAGVLDVAGGVRWRDTSKRSSRTSKEYLRPRYCLLGLCTNATPWMILIPCASCDESVMTSHFVTSSRCIQVMKNSSTIWNDLLSVAPLVRALSSSADATDVQETIRDDTGAKIGDMLTDTLNRHTIALKGILQRVEVPR